MRVVEYSEKYILSLIDMVYAFFKETYDTNFIGNKSTIEETIRRFQIEKSIYLLLGDDNKPKGFMVAYLNSEHNMVKPHIVCEYQYLKPTYRNGKAIMYLTHTLAEICTRLDMDIVNTTFITSNSYSNTKVLGANTVSITSIITAEQATKIYNKYNSRINK